MSGTTFRVNLHCHSTVSDGDLSPTQLATHLARNGVRYVALTDHDSADGLDAFKAAAARLGLGVLTGIELTATLWGREIHLLGYGVDPDHPALQAIVAAARRRVGLQPPKAAEVIVTIHDAGGIASFAHPLTSTDGPDEAASFTEELSSCGLDAIEAHYALYSQAERAGLEELADRLSLLVTGGSDFHGPERNGEAPPFVEFPAERWRPLRDAILRTGGVTPEPGPAASSEPTRKHGDRVRRPHPVARIAAPTAAAILLFVVAIFGIVLPGFERVLLDRKKEMIRELTRSVHSMLTQYEADVQRGQVTEEAAKRSAVEHLRGLRYGPDGRDYFWVTDRRPVMIVHPYRPDLEGTDVGEYRDASGKQVFHLFLQAVAKSDEGYVEYLWQWQDDASRIVPKLSFVKRFDPWGWVIGTGIYLDDVHAEIQRLESNLRAILAIIAAAVTVLVLLIAGQGLSAERSRQAAQASLTQAYERYRTLSESRTEGLIMTIDGACTFANETARTLLGYSEDEVNLLRVSDIVGPGAVEDQALERFVDILARGGSFPCVLKRKDSSLADALLAASPFELGGRRGSILSFRPIATGKSETQPSSTFPDHWPAALPVGLLRLRWNPDAEILWMNEQAAFLLGTSEKEIAIGKKLFDLVDVAEEPTSVLSRLEIRGSVVLTGRTAFAAGRFIKALIVTVRDEVGGARHLDGAVVDVTDEVAEARMSDALRRGMQSLPLFLGQTVGDLGSPVPRCPPDASMDEVARLGKAGCVVVTGPAGEPLGIIESGSVERALTMRSTRLGRELRAHEVMESPILRLPADASASEALHLFNFAGRSTLIVSEPNGSPPHALRDRDLLPALHDALWTLREEIRTGTSLADLRALRGRLSDVALLGLNNGQTAAAVMRGLSELSDLLAQALIDRVLEELGPAPGRFALLVLGSEGRREVAPGSDQDNALVYDSPDELAGSAADYYARLGDVLCAELQNMGLPACPGGIMASSAAWRGDLTSWKKRLAGWVAEPNPNQVLDLSIFLDFRAQAGDPALARELRVHLAALIADSPAFLPFLARSVAERGLPGFPRTGVLRDIGRDSGQSVELKALMAPIAGCARVLAVAGGLENTNTLSRLSSLESSRALKSADRREMEAAYEFLLSLRLSSRIRSSELGLEPHDGLPLAGLTQAEEVRLRHAHEQAGLAQRLLAHEFLGSAL